VHVVRHGYMSAPGHRRVWATLITRKSYLAAVLVLQRSLQLAGSKYPLIAMYTDALSERAQEVLRGSGIALRKVDHLAPRRNDMKPIEDRFADTWTKLAVFDLTEYDVRLCLYIPSTA
jgi:alpha-N-acetylglucosamine transferase